MKPFFTSLSGQRQHFQHGPIDLIVQADGDPAVVNQAHQYAQKRFEVVLPTLVSELGRLRQPIYSGTNNPMVGLVARRMWQSCRPFADTVFLTPMAAVAGSVAQHMLAAYQVPGIERAWVNNGGDIAIHLTGAAQLKLGLFSDLNRLPLFMLKAQMPELDAMATISSDSGVGGVATSGWAGRSHSLGIADSVTVFAADAGIADAAATVLANAVNVDDDLIVRQPANRLSDDTDLEDRLVTVAVPKLAHAQVARALARGLKVAQYFVDEGLLKSVVLMCQGQVVSATRMSDAIKERELCQLS
jgi:hypothetical protein